jgi:hypothetical protein
VFVLFFGGVGQFDACRLVLHALSFLYFIICSVSSLDFLATSQLADDQVPLFLQTVFPALHTVFVAPHFDESAKSRAASVVAAVVLWIGAMQSQNPEKLAAVISQSMQMWMEGKTNKLLICFLKCKKHFQGFVLCLQSATAQTGVVN